MSRDRSQPAFSGIKEKTAFYMEHIAPHRHSLLAFCRSVANDPDEAEDAAQYALEKAWEKLEQLADPQCAESWLFSIAKHQVCRVRRQPAWEALPDEILLPHTVSAEDAAIAEADIQVIGELLRQLPFAERQAVYCCCVLGMKPSQLAEILHVSSRTVSARLYRGRRTLRKKWEELF